MIPWAEREGRRLGKARALLQPAVGNLKGIWADLGCGDGIFTAALHTLLQPDHEIYAVDQSRRALRALVQNFAESYPEAVVHPLRSDFTHPLSLTPLDGLVMANSLHFVKLKKEVLIRLVGWLKPGGRLVIVEYNTDRGNMAVPHPLDEAGFLKLAAAVGLSDARIAAKISSTFLGEMYAGLAIKH